MAKDPLSFPIKSHRSTGDIRRRPPRAGPRLSHVTLPSVVQGPCWAHECLRQAQARVAGSVALPSGPEPSTDPSCPLSSPSGSGFPRRAALTSSSGIYRKRPEGSPGPAPGPAPTRRKGWPFSRPPSGSLPASIRRVGGRARPLTTFCVDGRQAAAACGWRPRPPTGRGGAGGGPGPQAPPSPGPRWSSCSPRWCCGRPRQVRRRHRRRTAPEAPGGFRMSRACTC